MVIVRILVLLVEANEAFILLFFSEAMQFHEI